MPSGFKKEHRIILMEILNAICKEKHVLVFAAPANWSNTEEVAFPGRLYKSFKVISMFSTTAQNKPTPEFNPAPTKDFKFNLAIFGELVVIPPKKEALNGTSVSTMIGAGVAARILAFAEHPDYEAKIPSIRNLRMVEGMSSVFKAMSVYENGYDCVGPERLLPKDIQGTDTKTVIDHVCAMIETNLNNL
jgi:hypothetical protein